MPENKSNRGEFRNDESGSVKRPSPKEIEKIIKESKKK